MSQPPLSETFLNRLSPVSAGGVYSYNMLYCSLYHLPYFDKNKFVHLFGAFLTLETESSPGADCGCFPVPSRVSET